MFETAAIIISIALVWAIFPAGLAYAVYKLEIESGGIKDDHAHSAHHDEEDQQEKMAA